MTREWSNGPSRDSCEGPKLRDLRRRRSFRLAVAHMTMNRPHQIRLPKFKVLTLTDSNAIKEHPFIWNVLVIRTERCSTTKLG